MPSVRSYDSDTSELNRPRRTVFVTDDSHVLYDPYCDCSTVRTPSSFAVLVMTLMAPAMALEP